MEAMDNEDVLIVYGVVPEKRTESWEEACQRGIEFGGPIFLARFGKPPARVALPSGLDLSRMQLWTLQVADNKASRGTIQLLPPENGRILFKTCPNPECSAEQFKPTCRCWSCGFVS